MPLLSHEMYPVSVIRVPTCNFNPRLFPPQRAGPAGAAAGLAAAIGDGVDYSLAGTPRTPGRSQRFAAFYAFHRRLGPRGWPAGPQGFASPAERGVRSSQQAGLGVAHGWELAYNRALALPTPAPPPPPAERPRAGAGAGAGAVAARGGSSACSERFVQLLITEPFRPRFRPVSGAAAFWRRGKPSSQAAPARPVPPPPPPPVPPHRRGSVASARLAATLVSLDKDSAASLAAAAAVAVPPAYAAYVPDAEVVRMGLLPADWAPTVPAGPPPVVPRLDLVNLAAGGARPSRVVTAEDIAANNASAAPTDNGSALAAEPSRRSTISSARSASSRAPSSRRP